MLADAFSFSHGMLGSQLLAHQQSLQACIHVLSRAQGLLGAVQLAPASSAVEFAAWRLTQDLQSVVVEGWLGVSHAAEHVGEMPG